MTELLSYPSNSGTDRYCTDLIFAFERLRGEHNRIYAGISQLECMAKQFKKTDDPLILLDRLNDLKGKTVSLVAELDGHSEWEDTQLFPLLTDYFQLPDRPTVTTSLWMLEKEHELAATYFRLFLEEAELCLISPEKIKGSCPTEQLLQACRLIKGHLKMEEETIFPLEEELRV